MQNAVASGSSKAVFNVEKSTLQETGPDYDEVKDEPSSDHKSSEKLIQEEKSVELIESSNNYFTLMPPEEEESTSNVTTFFDYFV